MLLLDPSLLKPLEVMLTMPELKARGVRKMALLPVSGALHMQPEDPETVILLVRPHPEAARAVAAVIRSDSQREYHVFCVPAKTLLFERLLTVRRRRGESRERAWETEIRHPPGFSLHLRPRACWAASSRLPSGTCTCCRWTATC